MNPTGQGRPSSSPGTFTLCQPLVLLEALARYVPPEQIDAALRGTSGRRKRRVRKIPAAATVWLVIAIALWGELDVPSLWRQVVGTLASLWRVVAGIKPPCMSALSQARARLGPRPLRWLFRATAAAAATTQVKSRGALYKAMPLKAMDGDDYILPDTLANAKAFGKAATTRNGREVPAGYPQAHVTRLIEVGTRMTLEALIKPYGTNDHTSAPALLGNCAAGDLVLWDCGFYSYKLIRQAIEQGTFMLGPVLSHVVLQRTG